MNLDRSFAFPGAFHQSATMRHLYLSILLVALPLAVHAARKPLTESTFTHVINEVSVLQQESQSVIPAKVDALFKTPDMLRTGADSLAEMIAPDKTITRIGSSTVFSFEQQGRTINLKDGSVLFHAPRRRGGGTIKTAGASASVLGTTIMVATTSDGGFKTIVVEGRARVTLPNGAFRNLRAGQLIFVLPGRPAFGPTLNISLKTLVDGSRLVKGFEEELPSVEKIDDAIADQQELINRGDAEDTGVLVGSYATEDDVQVVDSDFLERALIESPLRRALRLASRTSVQLNSSQDLQNPVHLFNSLFTPADLPEDLNGSRAGVNAIGRDSLRGFVGLDIDITAMILDLSPYTADGIGFFDFIS